MITAEIFIRKNATGEVRHGRERMASEASAVSWWSDGNGACDCNRELYFERYGGKEIDYDTCSDGRFSVCIRSPETGVWWYREWEELSDES